MKLFKATLLLSLFALAMGCNSTKFNRGVQTIPNDFKRWTAAEVETSKSGYKDIQRWLLHGYENSVEASNDVKRWTIQEWDGVKDSGVWVKDTTIAEFELTRDFAKTSYRVYESIGTDIKGLWKDTYSLMSYEIAVSGTIDEDTRRYLYQEVERFATLGKGIESSMRTTYDNSIEMRKFIDNFFEKESESGRGFLKEIRDFFTRDVDLPRR